MAALIPMLLMVSTVGSSLEPTGGDRVPVLVELFTSEGCSSCPPADAALARLLEEQPVPGARVIALGEHVDYWDGLGWKDRFSARIHSERQDAYVRRLRLSGPYTPQLVVGGRFQTLGSDAAGARAAVAACRSREGSITIHVASRSAEQVILDVAADWRSGLEADVMLALVEDRATSHVTSGENAGRTLTHVAIVKSLNVLGTATGAFSGRATLEHLQLLRASHAIAFVQERGGGRVYAVESIALTR